MYRPLVTPATSLPRIRRRTTTALLLGAVAAVSLGACSTSSTSATTTTKPASAAKTSVCTLITPAQVGTALGRTVHAASATTRAKSTTCTYSAPSKSDAVLIVFHGGVSQSDAASQQASLAISHGSTTDVSGPGFTAYYFTTSTTGGTVTTLVTLVGQTQVAINSTATLSQEEALATQIFDTLQAQTASSSTTSPTAPSATTATTSTHP